MREQSVTTTDQYCRLVNCGLGTDKGFYSLSDLIAICKLKYPPETELCFCSLLSEDFGNFTECEPYDTEDCFRIEYDEESELWACPCFNGKWPSGVTLMECLVQVIELLHACEVDLTWPMSKATWRLNQ